MIEILERAATTIAERRAVDRGQKWLRSASFTDSAPPQFGLYTSAQCHAEEPCDYAVDGWPHPPRMTLQNPPAFFQSATGQTEDGRHDGRCVPIDEVIEWSMTSRGGKQFELFAATQQESGCMRWGMCETASE